MGDLPEFTEIDRRLLAELKRSGFYPKVVYDIGAAKGYWSGHVSDSVFPDAAYHLFEPLAETEQYIEHLRRVAAGHPRFTVHCTALGATQGRVSFWTDAEQYGSTAIDITGEPGFTRRSVAMHRLDDYVADRRLSMPDLLKLDVQGFELEIFRGASRCLEHATALYVETWLSRAYGPPTPLLYEIQECLCNSGFDLIELGDRYYATGHALVSVDALFVKRSWTRAEGRELRPGDWVYRR
jgi:FkbM family methyltransferase